MAVATGTALAIGGGLLASGIAKNLIEGESARDAARIQTRAVEKGQKQQQQQFQQALGIQQPFLRRGQQAFQTLQDLTTQQLGQQPQALEPGTQAFQPQQGQQQFTLQDILGQDPGFQFRQQQGEQALERFGASKGRALGGRAIKESLRFNQGLASQEAGQAFNRFQSQQGQQFGQNLAQQQLAAQTQGQRFGELLAGRRQQFAEQQAPISTLAGLANVGPQLASSIGGQFVGQGQQLAQSQQALGNISSAREIAQGRAMGGPFGTIQQLLPLLALQGGIK